MCEAEPSSVLDVMAEALLTDDKRARAARDELAQATHDEQLLPAELARLAVGGTAVMVTTAAAFVALPVAGFVLAVYAAHLHVAVSVVVAMASVGSSAGAWKLGNLVKARLMRRTIRIARERHAARLPAASSTGAPVPALGATTSR